MSVRQRIALLVQAEGARRAGQDIDSTADATRRLERQTERAQRRTARANAQAQRFRQTLRGVGRAAAVGAAAGIAGMTLWIGEGVKSLGRIDRIGRQTTAVIQSTGGAANVSRAHIEALAGDLERLTSVEAESIQEGQNMLLTFTNIANGVGKGNDIFDQATRILTDMSVALGSDPKKAAIQLGKALNDPIKGVTALSKVGVSFTEDQKKQIKTLVESGKAMEAQKIILAELNKEFGGSGAAKGRSTEGQWALVMHEVGTLQEELAGLLMPTIRDASKTVRRFVQEMVDGTGNGGRFRDAIIGVAKGVGSAVTKVGEAKRTVQGFIADFRAGKPAAVLLGNAIIALVAAFLAFKTVAIVQAIFYGITTAAWGLNGALAANPVGLVVAAFAALVASVVVAYHKVGWFRAGVDAVWGALKVAWAWLAANGGNIIKYIPLVALIRNWGRVKAAGVGAFNAIKNTVGKVAKWIGDKVQSIIGAVQKAIDKIKSIPGVGGVISGAEKVGGFVGGLVGGGDDDEPSGDRNSAGGGAEPSARRQSIGAGRELAPAVPLSAAAGPSGDTILDLTIPVTIDGRQVGTATRRVALRDLLAQAAT